MHELGARLKKVKKIFVISHMACGGAQRVLSTVANAYVQRGHDVVIITFSNGREVFFPLVEGVRTIYLDCFGKSAGILDALRSNWIRITRLRRILKALVPGNIMSFMPETSVIVLLATIGIRGSRVIVSERSVPTKDKIGKVWQVLRKLSYKLADKITVNSVDAKREIELIVRSGVIEYLPNILCLKDDYNRGQVASRTMDSKSILTVSRLSREKRVDVLLAALGALEKEGVLGDWKILVAGDGPEKTSLMALCDVLGIAERVQFLGWVGDSSALYEAASLFVLCSEYEGTPNALLEAMAYGLPVITSRCSQEVERLVVKSKCGAVYDVGDVAALGRLIRTFLEDQHLRQEMGHRALGAVQRYMPENAIPAWEKVI